MSEAPFTEFDQFRFIRKEDGALAELPGTGGNERLFLVLDCRRYRLARLHIFEGRAARDTDAPNVFRREFEALSELQHPMLSPLISFGRDDTELFYADAVVDGESLREYLRRTGPVPPMAALHAILDLVSVLQVEPSGTHTLTNYSTKNLFVKPAGDEGISLIYSDFNGWDKKEIEDDSELVMRVTVTLYSLLAGEIFERNPAIPFTTEAVNTPEPVRNLVKQVFVYREDGCPFRNLQDFTEAVAGALIELPEEASPRPPVRFFRDWLIEGLTEGLDLGPELKLLSKGSGTSSSLFESGYTIDAATTTGLTYKRIRFHLYPNESSIPRAGWMDQHRYSLRSHGRPLPNQEPVERVLVDERFSLIGEAWIDGVSLASIVRELGPRGFDHAREIAQKLAAALDSMEAIAGSCPIWWLPPENLYAITGSEKIDSVREALDKNGIDTWKRTPLRLRLHQTAESLLDGVSLPSSLVDLMHTGSKDHVDARRSAVLLPTIWFIVTGERLNWKRPLPWHDSFAVEIYNILEESRKNLVESPDSEQGRLLDRIAATLRGKKLDLTPFKSGTGPLKLGKQSGRQLLPEVEPASPMEAVAAELAARKKKKAAATTPGSEEKAPAKEEPATAKEPDASERKTEDAPTSSDSDADPEAPESKEPEKKESPDLKKTEAPAEDAHWVKRVANEPKPANPRLASRKKKPQKNDSFQDETPGDGFAERLIFPNAKLDDDEGSSNNEEKSSSPWKRLSQKRRSDSYRSNPRKSRTPLKLPSRSLILFILFLVSASALGGIIWGGVTVFNHFASTINQQVLSETFSLVQYSPVTTSASEFAVPRLGHSEPDKKDTGTRTSSPEASLPEDLPAPQAITSSEEAKSTGDKARENGQLASALSYYLRAVEIDPAFVAAKDKISATVEEWLKDEGKTIQSLEEARLVEKAAAQNRKASRLLADFYLQRDQEIGLRWLQRSAEAGYPPHQVLLGLIFARGQLVPRELNIATLWFQRAANKGDTDGQFHFGECLILGEGITRDAPRGIDFLERAARAGDARALELLGICHAKGDGVNPSGARARDYFEQAVAAGNVSAYYNLAVRHAKGHGVDKNEMLAAETFRKGAENGNVPCMYAFGRCLETGFGASPDIEKAKAWLTKAAHLGSADAQAWCANNEVPFDKPIELLSEL